MSFPLVPLPPAWATPDRVLAHQNAAMTIAVLCAFFGCLILMLWSMNEDSPDKRAWILFGFLFLGVAALGAAFGLYLMVLLIAVLGGLLVRSIFFGIRTLFI